MCGHFDNKEVLPIDEYLIKLKAVISIRNDIFVIARTDTLTPTDGFIRAVNYAEAGANGIMVEAITDLDVVYKLSNEVDCPIMVNQLQGGKSPNWSLQELEDAGVSIVIYSTPSLFSAQYGMETFFKSMKENGIMPTNGTVGMDDCVNMLKTPIRD
jgi:2-methylisocitrate lyase-like PEP mutase family enzyme